MASNKQVALMCAASSALTLTAYFGLKKLMCPASSSSSRCPFAHKSSTAPTEEVKIEPSKIYEERELLDQYMLFNYATGKDLLMFDLNELADVQNCFQFPKRVALLCREHCPDLFTSNQPRTAIDIGCAVGRSCFELAKLFDSVLGIDYSSNFVEHAKKMMRDKVVSYECRLEGDVFQKLSARLDDDVDTSKLSFEVGDACNLRSDLGAYDLVLASNLICRLTEPLKFLEHLDSLVKPAGYVILSTPFTWGEQYTPKSKWIGGYYDENGAAVEGIDGLKRALGGKFKLCKQLDMPMFIRETKRKFQYTVCLITIWQKI